MKIAILHCKQAQDVCTGSACFNAYNNHLKSFAQYSNMSTILSAFMDCGGCGIDFKTHAGIIEKMDRLKSEGIEKIHLGVCINKEKCPRYENIIEMLDKWGIAYEYGTH